MRQTTLCLLLKENEILLAMKKRGFGQGRWNGAGGKFDPEKGDKTILEAAIRETKEEIGVEIKNPDKVAVFHFRFQDKEEWNQDVSLFVVKEWEGEPSESEEMMPKWFEFKDIPYKDMWPDDIHWMPHILEGKKLEANFLFGAGDKILDYNLNIIRNI
ncbi:MAG: 8-oxo-dGTP diphosphatase [Candidatus Staskawiczbacteria bacterium]|nr:8-oxo-dGTP diphosphatase [Candidatus Staskawiczbacteria bacterium]